MARLRVDVVYARPARQEIVSVEVEEGATALDAIRSSGLLEQHAELRSHPLRLGVFGVEVAADARLAEGDRVELYRPLTLDPKEARRARAKRAARR